MAAKEFPFGVQVRDIVSGFEGIVTSRTDMINGMVQYGVTPRITGHDNVLKARTIDPAQLVETGRGVTEKIQQPVARQVPIKLGQVVEDVTTGMIGVAFEKLIFMNGCVYFVIRLPVSKSKKRRGDLAREAVLPMEVLRVVNAQTVIPEATDSPGGPARFARLC